MTKFVEESVLINEKVKPRLVLPVGWVVVWSKSNKRWYFFDTVKNKSVWEIGLVKNTNGPPAA